MTELAYWKSSWYLDEDSCPCDIHVGDYLEENAIRDASIFHFGTGEHHHLGIRTAENGSNNAVLGITASREEYDAYVKLVIERPRIGNSYKAYFGDIYQTDSRLLPDLDYAALVHIGEFWSERILDYGGLTDLGMTLAVANKLKPGGEIFFYTGSFAADKAKEVAAVLVREHGFEDRGLYKTLHVLRKPG